MQTSIATRIGITAICLLAGVSSFGATVTLGSKPVVSSSSVSVKPNIMFVLDDSGSMTSDYMPDYVKDESLCKGTSGFVQCDKGDPPFNSANFNGVYYNPKNTYAPALQNDGKTSMGAQFRISGGTKKWDQVQTDPFSDPTNKTNLETGFADIVWCTTNSPNTSQLNSADNPASGSVCRKNGMGYTGSPAVSAGYNYPSGSYVNRVSRSGAPYYYTLVVDWCKNSNLSGTCQPTKDSTYQYPKYSAVTRVEITSTKCSPTCPGLAARTYENEMTNFANWYAYYRTRQLMAKTAAGQAFSTLNDNYRVGFMTIHTTSSSSSDYLKVDTFTASVPASSSDQRTKWYNELYGAGSLSATPLKPALSLVGRMYAGVALDDPVQYTCQKNIAILTTDGYWNSGSGATIDGSTPIGNHDNVDSGFSQRPKYDGGLSDSTDTLADVAMYYYKTDLRTGAAWDGKNNNVQGTTRDPATHQHMTTYTIGMGVSGTLIYKPTYETDSSGDFAAIRAGTKNWPTPSANNPTSVDDLWHAAVNGGGVYYSASDPQSLVEGLSDALQEIEAKPSAAAAAATSNPNVVAGDNYVFSSTFRTGFWDGELVRQQIDPNLGTLGGIDWSAQSKLHTKISTASGGNGTPQDGRTIYMWSGTGATKMKAFTWANLSAAQQAWFAPALTSQYPTLSATGKTLADAPGSMINYLRGQTALEDDVGSVHIPYRGREFALGDIVSAEAVYVKRPKFKYTENSYTAYVTAKAGRKAMVYVAANDGMLHAFDATTGDEDWAYVPSMVMPNMYKLADKDYDHSFYVDGTPVVGDVYVGGQWRTILVGGLNGGGKGFYALDITDTGSPPIALWEVCDAGCSVPIGTIGYSFGNPIITKVAGQWSVLLTSGYNNSDGKGYLYILDPVTGAHRSGSPLLVSSGCVGSHCGFARINGWVDDVVDNSTTDVYGGDLDGNLWRIQVSKRQGESAHPATPIVTKLAQLGGSSIGNQPITTRPELGAIDDDRIVLVGTGRLLSLSDLADTTSKHTFYGIKDPLGTTGWGNNLHDNSLLVKQIVTEKTGKNGERLRTSTNNLVDWSSKAGWYVDLPDPGERNNTDATLALGTIVFSTNVPSVTPCTDGGYSWLYELNFKNGGFVTNAETTADGSPIAAMWLGNGFATRPIAVKLPNGKLLSITTLSNKASSKTPGAVNDIYYNRGLKGRRSTWRELIQDR